MYGIIGYIRIQAVLILLLTGTVRSLFSQQDAFIKILDNGLGGFGGPQYKLTQINGSYALVSGGPHGIMINPNWGVFASANYLEFDVDGLEMGFGAIGGEYNFFQGGFFSFPLLFRQAMVE